jgi:hypothetical protein
MMDGFFATLEARDPGRIGASGRRMRHVAQNKDEAMKLVRRSLRTSG